MIITPKAACHGKSFDGLLKKYFGKNKLPYVSKIYVSIKGNGLDFPFLFLFFITFEQKGRKMADEQQEKPVDCQENRKLKSILRRNRFLAQ